jgi:hypothetical protein
MGENLFSFAGRFPLKRLSNLKMLRAVKGYAVTDNAFTVKFKIKQDRQCTCNVT